MSARLRSWVATGVANIKDFYNDINPATLSGAIDIIVVRQPDGTLRCSPFHVRFGKLYLLRPKEKTVHVCINDEPVHLNMKIGEAGEAYFSTEDDLVSDVASGVASAGSLSPPLERRRLISENSDADSCKSAPETSRVPPGSPDRRQPNELAAPDCDVPLDQVKPSVHFVDEPTDVYEWRWGDFPSTDEPLPAADAAGLDPAAGPRGTEPGLLSRLGAILGRTPTETASNSGDNTGVYLSDIEPTDQQAAAGEGAVPRVPDEDLDAVSFHSMPEDDTATVHADTAEGPSTSPDDEPRRSSDTTSVDTLGHESRARSVSDVRSRSAELAIRLSLCGKARRDFTAPEAAEAFEKSVVSFDKFNGNPGLLSDPNLVVQFNGKYFTWLEAAPMILSLVAFQRPLEPATIDKLLLEESRRGWFYGLFSSKADKKDGKLITPSPTVTDLPPVQPNGTPPGTVVGPLAAANDPAVAAIAAIAAPTAPAAAVVSEAPLDAVQAADLGVARSASPAPTIRALKLTSEQLAKLNLREGANKATFTIISKMQGKHTVQCSIYLWNFDSKVVISDIDGTITKSDVMGHVAAFLSKDWTHVGVAGLYSAIEKNGYKFVYLSSRSISHAGPTRGYLKGVLQKEGFKLPDGPVLLSPASLFQSIHQEVIKRRPEEFKVACLRDIRRLFPRCAKSICTCCCITEGPENYSPCTCEGEGPFTAGFGNRATDELSYLAVGVPPSRIFTIDPSSSVRLSNCVYRSSYEDLNQIVDQIFPPIRINPTAPSDFNDFAYWRSTLPPIDLPALS
eukprot:m.230281 g.230281  ORF g.230281 m.230281 type:complete len:791 (+) comp12040_c0_seq1:234-2606(+)